MTEYSAKKIRADRASRTKRIAAGSTRGEIDASSWKPPGASGSDEQTGPKPVSRRAFKDGGKVGGEAAVQHAGKAPRKGRAEGGPAYDRSLSPAENVARHQAASKAGRDVTPAPRLLTGPKNPGTDVTPAPRRLTGPKNPGTDVTPAPRLLTGPKNPGTDVTPAPRLLTGPKNQLTRTIRGLMEKEGVGASGRGSKAMGRAGALAVLAAGLSQVYDNSKKSEAATPVTPRPAVTPRSAAGLFPPRSETSDRVPGEGAQTGRGPVAPTPVARTTPTPVARSTPAASSDDNSAEKLNRAELQRLEAGDRIRAIVQREATAADARATPVDVPESDGKEFDFGNKRGGRIKRAEGGPLDSDFLGGTMSPTRKKHGGAADTGRPGRKRGGPVVNIVIASKAAPDQQAEAMRPQAPPASPFVAVPPPPMGGPPPPMGGGAAMPMPPVAASAPDMPMPRKRGGRTFSAGAGGGKGRLEKLFHRG